MPAGGNLRYMSDIPSSFLEVATHVINSYSTGLTKVTFHPDRGEEVVLIGSGTFISIGEDYGILTAHHVLERLYEPCELGLVLDQREHRWTIDVAHLTLFEIAVPGIPGKGPDLAYIGLPSVRARSISSLKSFFNLDAHRSEILNYPPERHSSVWFINGIPDEYTKDDPSSSGFQIARSFQTLCGAGGASKIYEEAGYDYVEVVVSYQDDNELPSTFGGISGGGLWQVSLKSGEVDLEPDRYLFTGMPFAETRDITNSRRKIFCHGPASVFQKAYDVIRQRHAHPFATADPG